MSNQFRQRRRDQRWRMNRQLNNRRRVNIYLMEKRMTDLEIKVQGLLDREKARQQAEKLIAPVVGVPAKPNSLVRFWCWLRDVLCAKGKP